MFGGRISSSTGCSRWLPETSIPSGPGLYVLVGMYYLRARTCHRESRKRDRQITATYRVVQRWVPRAPLSPSPFTKLQHFRWDAAGQFRFVHQRVCRESPVKGDKMP